jgi:hypothetical protein
MRALAVTTAVFAVSLSSRLAAQGTGCADTKYPEPLPAPNALVDSAHAIADLGAFADPAKPMVFSVYFGSGDSVAHVRALENQDAAAAVTLANYVRHAHPGEFWAFRVRLAGGDAPALTIERSSYCPPVSREGDQPFTGKAATVTGSVAGTATGVVAGTMGTQLPPPPSNPTPIEPAAGGVPAAAAPGSVVLVEALIGADGHVVVGRVVQSTGNADRDAGLVHDLRRMKFEPAKLDGQPIQAVFRSRGESPRP